MTKGRTLRRIRKPSKKTYLSKGGQQALDYRDIQDAYVAQIAAKKELYNTIHLEAASAYNYETSKKNSSSLTEVQNILSFMRFNKTATDVDMFTTKFYFAPFQFIIKDIKRIKEVLL